VRILVTGSRNWADRDAVWSALNKAASVRSIILVHGDCPTGADAMAKAWCRTQPDVLEEAHPADWERYGKAAGPKRNQKMVDLGADICLAFPLPDSRGTLDCMAKAEAAGIPVRVVERG
jgi:hypothetical protein